MAVFPKVIAVYKGIVGAEKVYAVVLAGKVLVAFKSGDTAFIYPCVPEPCQH